MRQPSSNSVRAQPQVTKDPLSTQEPTQAPPLVSVDPFLSENPSHSESPSYSHSSSSSVEDIYARACRPISFTEQLCKTDIEIVVKNELDPSENRETKNETCLSEEDHIELTTDNNSKAPTHEEGEQPRARPTVPPAPQSPPRPQSPQSGTYPGPLSSLDAMGKSSNSSRLTQPLSPSVTKNETIAPSSPGFTELRSSTKRSKSSVSLRDTKNIKSSRNASLLSSHPDTPTRSSSHSKNRTPGLIRKSSRLLSRDFPDREQSPRNSSSKLNTQSTPRFPAPRETSRDDLSLIDNVANDDPNLDGHVIKNSQLQDADPIVVTNQAMNEVTTEHIKMSLSCLPLRNIAVAIPEFTRWADPSTSDRAVITAVEDIITTEAQRRKKDEFAVANHLRVGLIVVPDSRRADVWMTLLQRTSKLRAASFGVSNARARPKWHTANELDEMFDAEDLIVTSDRALLNVMRSESLTLRRVALLVFDSAETMSNRRHPCSVLMRDYYRALPMSHRPRVLAIAIAQMCGGRIPPIEYNLLSKFVSLVSSGEAVWKSSYGRGSRPHDAGFLDVENVWYKPEVLESEMSVFLKEKRKTSTPRKREKKNYSDLDHIAEQIGPLGVSLYKRRKNMKNFANASVGKQAKLAFKTARMCISDDTSLLGISQKTLHLLNELHLAFSSSTAVDPVFAVVHAGVPGIAFALLEVIKAMPIFKNLRVGVAVGANRYRMSESVDDDDDITDAYTQGDDTDDEEVSSFAAGDLNVLIVTGRYLSPGARSRPLPPSPLVIRFDGTFPDPTIDGGGGRCRVIVFRESKPIDRGMSTTKPLTMNHISRNHSDALIAKQAGEDGIPANSRPDDTDQAKDPISNEIEIDAGYVSDLEETTEAKNEAEAKQKAVQAVLEQTNKTEEGEVLEIENAITYYCKPPASLRAPKDKISPVFLYRLSIEDESQSYGDSVVFNAGIENFFLVLSEKLIEYEEKMPWNGAIDDREICLSLRGVLSLEFHGSVIFSQEQLSVARSYTEAIYKICHESTEPLPFFWDGIPKSGELLNKDRDDDDSLNVSFLRRYLLLPNKPKQNENPKTELLSQDSTKAKENASTKKKTISQKIMATYFTTTSSWNAVSEGPFQIDWDRAKEVGHLGKPENVDLERRKPGMVSSEAFECVEGSLLFSSFPGESVILSGRLQHDYSPLTTLVRSRKFPLTEEGKLENHDDLVHLIPIEVPSEDLKDQESKSTAESDEQNDLTEKTEKSQQTNESNLKNYSLSRWCNKRLRLVPHIVKSIGKKQKKRNKPLLFDSKRNLMKKRSTWVGKVRYSAEKYYNRYFPNMIKTLHQPLLAASRPSYAGFSELAELLRGVHIEDICHRLALNGKERRLVVPELGRKYPVPIGVVFLRPLLFSLERHLAICELRKKFDSLIGVEGNLEKMTSAITASHVSSNNYERLELLGDSVLKLSCTIRLFTSKPHDNEGQMHTVRKYRVSNDRLHRLGHANGIHNYVRFQAESLAEWKPPGTEIQGKAQKVSMKGLADVVEALCGAYFLSGVADGSFDVGKQNDEVNRQKEEGKSIWTTGISCYSSSGSDSSSSDEEASSLTKNDSKKRTEKPNKKARKRRKQSPTETKNSEEFSATSIERGYQAGYKFLEACKVLEDSEPSHKEILLSSIYALHPRDSSRPAEVTLEAFPPDKRLLRPAQPWEDGLGRLEQIIGYKFKRRHLLLCALTHNSYQNLSHTKSKRKSSDQSYQRLEFLGDAVADFCVVCYLYDKFPELGPGELTELKGNVVSNEAFARTSILHGLDRFIFVGATHRKDINVFLETIHDGDEDRIGGQEVLKHSLGEMAAPKILGDIFEAIIGAVFVDSGLQQAWNVCHRLLASSLRMNADPTREDSHPCAILKSMITNVWKLSPNGPCYEIDSERENGVTWKIVTVKILGMKIATEKGSTAKRAKLRASVTALKLLNNDDANSFGGKLLKQLREESLRRRVENQRAFEFS